MDRLRAHFDALRVGHDVPDTWFRQAEALLERAEGDDWVDSLAPVTTLPPLDPEGDGASSPTFDLSAEGETRGARVRGRAQSAGLLGLPARYRVVDQLGAGGMGEVWRVQDRELGRTVALKVLRGDNLDSSRSLARFVAEAQVSAQLQHPGIVPVHDMGRLPDGRIYFTMKQVRGHTLGEVIRAVHAASASGAWAPTPAPDGRGVWSFRLLVDLFGRVCDTVAYAHARGVLHRDLKPDNIMVGAFGELLVLDWGLVKVIRRSSDEARTDDVVVQPTAQAGLGSPVEQLTHAGQVAGTPAYMAPEQARGDIDALGPHSDVYALGGLLYQILAGRAPYWELTPESLLEAVARGVPDPLPDDKPLPEDLVAFCYKAMSQAPSARYPDAGALASEVNAWLEGTKARGRALEVVRHSLSLGPQAAALRAEAADLRAQESAMARTIEAWEPIERKQPLWALQDRASALELEAELLAVRRVEGLQAALTHVPDLSEAHAALAETYLRQHQDAEPDANLAEVARAEVRLTHHTHALPGAHPTRSRATTYLRGDGWLTLVTDPPGARVALHRYEERDRRLVPVFLRDVGPTPISQHALPSGSYLLVITADGRVPVRYPVRIERGAHWDGVPPDSPTGEPLPVPLPRLGTVRPDEVYVPPGWALLGGDPEAYDSIPRSRLWLGGFVILEAPISNREYIAFLDDLVAKGREDEALQWAPRERAGKWGELGDILYGRTPEGGFRLVEDVDGDLWEPDWPVMMLDWHCAAAFGRWRAEVTGDPWRLPGEWEWEKAARGADGRVFPWGNTLDPTFCWIKDSHRGRGLPATTSHSPLDESPYGVLGLAGNTRDWCADIAGSPPPRDGERVRLMSRLDGGSEPGGVPRGRSAPGRMLRGGCWDTTAQLSRAAFRIDFVAEYRIPNLGVRLVRSFP